MMSNYNEPENHTTEREVEPEDNSPPISHISKGALDDIFDGLVEGVGNKPADKKETANSMKVEFDHIIDDYDDQFEYDHPDLFANERSSVKKRNQYYAYAFSLSVVIIAVLSFILFQNSKQSVSNRRSNVIAANIPDSHQKGNYRNGEKVNSDDQQTGVNTPPKLIEAEIIPVMLKTGPTMEVKLTSSDAEGDNIEYSYEWLLNDNFAGKGPQLTQPFKRGDVVRVTVTPYDGYDHGTPIVLSKDIINTPPQIIGGKSKLTGSMYSYQLETIDHDNDTLTYTLPSAPSGMTIDATGLIRWKVPEDYKGSVNLSVSITDGNGGKASQQLTLSITDLQAS